ncbi:septum site-determining protein MinC [Acidocella aromatica]|uniref:Probable septum site-determining protein MinC n=1 Tax=Acidocella aromatica TaxID=1303579 RepID=A0A840VGW7_9PROT|nr:septum site-determining protein MinC [Acidocella aromatica]MBB5374147.1 septum site-determining protein MinC [Acidocella aromatica]
MPVNAAAPALPQLRIRGRSFMCLILAPEPPLEAWFTALDEQLRRAASYFVNKPIVINLAVAQEAGGKLDEIVSALEARGLYIIAVEGLSADELTGTRWAGLPDLRQKPQDREDVGGKLIEIPDDPLPAPSVPAVTSLLIDRPVRSGQSIIFEDGDVTIIGPVSSGAEVIAGGSIHIYGALRGRAIAGLRAGANARIFCHKFGAELVAIDGVYDTPESWSEAFNNRAAQVRLEGGVLNIAPLA